MKIYSERLELAGPGMDYEMCITNSCSRIVYRIKY